MTNPDRCSRRQFFHRAGTTGLVAGLALKPLGSLTRALIGQGHTAAGGGGLRPPPSLRNVHHLVIDRAEATYSGRPRQCGIANFADGELAVTYRRGPCAYRTPADVSDSLDEGWLSGAEVVLRRSRDGGQSWSPESDVVVHSDALPVEQRVEFLSQDPATRAVPDMAAPGAMFFFGRSPLRVKKATRRDRWQGWYTQVTAEMPPNPTGGLNTVFQVRSTDRGQTWERVPLVIDPPSGVKALWADNHPLVTMPDGALIGVMQSEGALWLYGSECQGMTWQYLSRIVSVEEGAGSPSCGGLLLLPDGRVQCYGLLVGEGFSHLCLSESENCFSWTRPRLIGRPSRGYHAPWPLRLRDGRIVVLLACREDPMGIAVTVSEDDGATWSEEALVRDDAAGPDIGWPVATEMADGHIFTAYQWQLADGNGLGGTRFVAGSFFEPA